MNRYPKKPFRIWWPAIISLLTSCVYEDETPCPCEIRFVYDYNMEFADAFPKQVNDVTLFIFDNDGKFVSSRQDQGEHLDADYRMSLELVPGRYQLVAWAGTCTDKACYNLTADLKPGLSTLQDLQLTLNCTAGKYDKNPSDLWQGMLADLKVSATAPTDATIPLVKDNNHVKVLLQTTTGEALSKNDYSFAIVDANYCFNYDNTLRSVPNIAYQPYQLDEVNIDNDANPAGRTADGNISALVAELGTLRLMADRSPRFVIRNERKNQEIFNIDLKKYLDMMRLSQYASMPLQEFLDRENTYYVILVMGENPDGTQMMISMQINAWRMVFNQTDL